MLLRYFHFVFLAALAKLAPKINDDDNVDDDDDRERFLQIISKISAELISPVLKVLVYTASCEWLMYTLVRKV